MNGLLFLKLIENVTVQIKELQDFRDPVVHSCDTYPL